MIIEIRKVSPDGSRYAGEQPHAALGLDKDPAVRLQEPVRYALLAQMVSHELVVQGTVSTRLGLQCCRCAEFYSTTVADSSFLRAYDIPEGVESVDLTDDIREAILLGMPHFPLCSPDCKGLCPQCGANWNRGACACRPPSDEGRWSGLDGLKVT